MLTSVLPHLFSKLGKALGVLNSIDPAIRTPLAVSFGAIPGALTRYYLTLLFTQQVGSSFPYGTFVINVSGALLMGFFATLALERIVISPDLRLMIAVGFLGSYTTFSTYALDTGTLLRTGSQSAALTYWVVTMIDTAEVIAAFLPVVQQMVKRGIITQSTAAVVHHA